METKFAIPPPTTSHFTLSPFFSQIPGAMNSSHSLPPSPSRPLPGFTATPLKFFPVTAIQGRAADDLDLMKSQRKMTCETIHEMREEHDEEGSSEKKRPRLNDHPMEAISQSQTRPAVTQLQGITSINAPRIQFTQPGPLQFLPISLMSSANLSGGPQQPPQNLLGAPLSSFLPQRYFGQGGVVPTVATMPTPSNQAPLEARNNNAAAHGTSNEG